MLKFQSGNIWISLYLIIVYGHNIIFKKGRSDGYSNLLTTQPPYLVFSGLLTCTRRSVYDQITCNILEVLLNDTNTNIAVIQDYILKICTQRIRLLVYHFP